MNKSLDTLFTMQRISGEVHGNSIDLTWEGGAGTFQKTKASERNKALQRLNVLSVQIIWMHKVERTEKTKSAITELKGQAGPLEERMATVLSRHNALSKQYKRRAKQLASLDA